MTDGQRDSIIMRETREMDTPCQGNIEYDRARSRFLAPHRWQRFGNVSRCTTCRSDYTHEALS